MAQSEQTLDDLLPGFDSSNDPEDDFRTMAEWIEKVESLLRLGEFAQLGAVESRGRTYSIRVNGSEHEAPHVHVRVGSDQIGIFLGATPDDIEPDNSADPSYRRVIRNRATRTLIESYVKAHHTCLHQAWADSGNPVHAGAAGLKFECVEHPLARPPRELLSVTAEGLNAHLDERE